MTPHSDTSRFLTITCICIGSAIQVGKQPVLQAVLGPCGLQGDRHGRETVRVRSGPRRGTIIFNERQWSAVGEEEMAAIGQALGVILPPGSLGENFRFAGNPDLSHLPFGTRLCFPSGAVLMVSGQNFPCRKQADYLADLLGVEAPRRGFIPAARDRRGIIGWVEREGPATVGDCVEVEFPPAHS